jgi:hypothetical protein
MLVRKLLFKELSKHIQLRDERTIFCMNKISQAVSEMERLGYDMADTFSLFKIKMSAVTNMLSSNHKCPICGGDFVISRLNIRKDSIIGGDGKYLISCSNNRFPEFCEYEFIVNDIDDDINIWGTGEKNGKQF